MILQREGLRGAACQASSASKESTCMGNGDEERATDVLQIDEFRRRQKAKRETTKEAIAYRYEGWPAVSVRLVFACVDTRMGCNTGFIAFLSLPRTSAFYSQIPIVLYCLAFLCSSSVSRAKSLPVLHVYASREKPPLPPILDGSKIACKEPCL